MTTANGKAYRLSIEFGDLDLGDAIVRMYPDRNGEGHPLVYPWEEPCKAEGAQIDDDCRLITGKGQDFCYPCWLKNV
jgi:hypothetical protein